MKPVLGQAVLGQAVLGQAVLGQAVLGQAVLGQATLAQPEAQPDAQPSEGLVVYPGSFDPMTNGHLDVARRAARNFPRLVVAVVCNPNKRPMFALAERVEMLREACADLANVEVDSFDGLLVEYVRRRGASLIVKGLRIVADFEGEFTMALLNRKLAGHVDTMFLPASVEYAYVSSSSVREIFALGGDVSEFVPPSVLRAMASLRGKVS